MGYVGKNPKFDSTILKDLLLTTPGNPASGSIKVINRNGKLFLRDSTGAEVPVGTAGAAGRNYFSANSDAEASVVGYATYADAAGVAPVDATGGSPNITWTRNTSAPLRGAADFLLTKDAANRQGQGVSFALTLDEADKNKMMQFSVDLKADSNYTDDEILLYLVNVTTGAVVYPTVQKVKKATYTFLSQVPVDTSADWRIALHIAGTSATAYTVQFDNFFFGPTPATLGVPRQGRTSYTPVTQGFGTVSSVACYYERDGEYLIGYGELTTGTVAASEAQIGLPTGCTIGGSANAILVGKVDSNAVVSDNNHNVLATAGDTFVNVGRHNMQSTATNMLLPANGDACFSSTTRISYWFRVLIAEWTGANIYLSQTQPEYSSNSSVTDADDTTSFVYGMAGSLIPTITASAGSTARTKRIRFLTPIQETDKIEIQLRENGGTGNWIPVGQTANYSGLDRQGSSRYGIFMSRVASSATDVDILFSQGGRIGSNATYAGTGASYPDTASDRWRVVKIPGQVQVASPTTVKYLRKTLSADVTTDTVISDFTQTLVLGRTYRVSMHCVGSAATSDQNVEILVKDGATEIGYSLAGNRDAGGNAGYNMTWSKIITVISGSITFTSSSFGAGSTISSTNGRSFVEFEELSAHVPVTSF